jgi:hypothetical protein
MKLEALVEAWKWRKSILDAVTNVAMRIGRSLLGFFGFRVL